MENLSAQHRRCKNCKFYVAHYIKENARFKTVDGHCTNDKKIARNRRKIITGFDSCEFWEQDEKNRNQQKESVRKTIIKMQEQLTQLLEVLENKE